MPQFSSPERPADLPDFSDPPVDEVVIGVVFMAIGFSSNHVAKYREAVKHALPGLQYQPRASIQYETLSKELFNPQPGLLGLALSPPQGSQPAQRTWLVSADDQRLIQIQDDLFLTNWRRRAERYPRFDTLIGEFWDRFSQFRTVLSQETPVPLQLQQLEVSYINWVPFDNAALSSWFAPAVAAYINTGQGEVRPEHQSWGASFLIEEDGVPITRLYGRQVEALRAGPGVPHLGAQLELTCRAPLAPGASDEEINDLAHKARNTIVRGFTSLTTAEAHKQWGRIQ